MVTKNDMMIGREREKAELQRSLESDRSEFVIVSKQGPVPMSRRICPKAMISDYRFFPLPKISAWVPVR